MSEVSFTFKKMSTPLGQNQGKEKLHYSTEYFCLVIRITEENNNRSFSKFLSNILLWIVLYFK